MNEEQIEEIGLLADKCENLLAALAMPLPAAIHLEGLKGGLSEIGERLRALHEATADSASAVQPEAPRCTCSPNWDECRSAAPCKLGQRLRAALAGTE